MSFRIRARIGAGVIAAAVVAVVLVLVLGSGGHPRPPVVSVDLATATPGRTVPDGFLGLSLEYSAIEAYVGKDPSQPNTVLEQLIRNLAPGQRPVLRIGGDSTDDTWWPAPGVRPTRGITFTLDPTWAAVMARLTHATDAQLLLGLNLELDSPTEVATERAKLTAALGAGSISAFELGNEPELYRKFPWYRDRLHRLVRGRPPSYGFAAFQQDFTHVAAALPGAALAAPSIGGPGWMPYIGGFLSAEPQVRTVAVHLYPLQKCGVPSDDPHFATIPDLLGPTASTGLADGFDGVLATAAAHRLPVRIDELNTVSCGTDPAVSQSFASALWAVDTLFEMLRVGVSGVNIHTFPGAGYDLFRFHDAGGRWQGDVSPEYYGLLLFAEAAPAGARLIDLDPPGGRDPSLKLWATAAPDGTERVVAIDKSMTDARTVRIRAGAGSAATIERLLAPSASATGGVTLGGRSIAPGSETGELAGPPRTEVVRARRGVLVVRLSAASAALITLHRA